MSSSFSLLVGSAGFAFGRRIKGLLASAKYTDYYWSNVTLLLTGDTLADYSSYERTLTVNDTIVDKSVKKVGTGSLKLTNGLTIPNTPNLIGTGDYTIEFWVKANASTLPYATIFKIGTPTGFALSLTRTGLYGSQTGDVISDTNVSGYAIYGYGSSQIQSMYDSGQWHQITISKNPSGIMIFIDGWIIGNPLVNITDFTPTDISIGTNFNGYIDDFRITSGVARHTSNFLVFDVPFPYVAKGPPFEKTMIVGNLATSFDLSANSFLYMGG